MITIPCTTCEYRLQDSDSYTNRVNDSFSDSAREEFDKNIQAHFDEKTEALNEHCKTCQYKIARY